LKSKVKHIVILILLTSVFFPVLGQLQKIERFELNDFLGEREFLSATQNENLLIYFNTSKGILSYDGEEFKNINLQLKNVNEIQIFNNALFLATQNSLFQYFIDKDSLVTLSDKNIIQFQKINNQLWMISETELLLWENENLKSIYQSEGEEVFKCFEINDKNTLLGHSKGITTLEKGKKNNTFASYLQPKRINTIDSISYILSEDAIFELNNGKIIRDFKNESSLIDFHIDYFSKIWFIENQNVLKVHDLSRSKPIYYDSDKNLIKGQTLFTDKENNLWVLGKNSLFKITENSPFSKLFEKNTLEVFVGENGNLIIKSDEIINYNLITGVKKIKNPLSNTPIEYCFAFQYQDHWLITLNNSIYSIDEKESSLNLIKNESNYLPLKNIGDNKFLAKNNNGNLFITNSDFNPIKKIENVDFEKKLIFFDQKIYAISNNSTVSILDLEGEIINKISIADTINQDNIRPSSRGLWYFTSSNLYIIDSNGNLKEIKYDSKEVLNSELILNIYDDNDDNLWVSSKKKLLRFPITERNDELILQKPISYNEKDFIFSSFFRFVVKDANERLWFLNEEGISIYNPLKEIPNMIPPGIRIENAFSYKLDDFKNPIDTVSLINDQKRISSNSIVVIEPKIINHLNNHKSTIGYRNLSINQSERRIENGELIILTDLEDGLNTINLKAYNSNGIESIEVANINIYVIPPIWKQNWFYLTSALSLLFLGFIGYKTVISIKNSRARELEDELHKGLEDLEKKSHLQILKAERLKQLNELITSQKSELEKKNKQIESQKYELSLTNQQIKKQKDLLEETSSKLTSSINYAKRIQNALMSTEVEIKKAFQDSFVYFVPRDVVSGDFFWFNKTTNEQGEELLILAAVDCTGHGVPGAIVSVVGMNLLNNITKLKNIYDPGQILTEMNKDIISDLRQDETQVNDGMDMTIVTYNTVSKQLYFAGAKNPLMYIEDNELIRIKGDKYAIGGQQRGDDRDFKTHHLDLTDGKLRTFYLFSDGYQDQFGGEKGFKYLVGNFKKLLISIHDKNALEQKTILHEEIEEWKDGYAQTDDILVIGFKL
jgi:serine phosphatase RsbU (regulator of sigma subunit)/DNA-binding transcriptional regulator/RsmH inhibitor MraZ